MEKEYHCPCCQAESQRGADLIMLHSLMCEEHPGTEWPHDDCIGPGMPWQISGKDEILKLKETTRAV